MSPSYSAPAPNPAPTFASLGVRPLINCQGTYTILSGSRALPQVAEAMLLATEGYVQMDELMEAIGRRLHDLTGAPWGYISSGCAAALCELTCAAIAGGDPEKMARLPDTSGMPNEIIIQHGHRNAYDRAMRAAGGVMVEVESPAELETAFSARTALVFVVGDQAHLGQICTADMIAAAHRHGIPCLVDAAAERPDIPNRYLALGADAVTYSGGKCLRGPQASGLVLGNKALLQAAYLNSAPHHGLGRPMKAGKEEVMGLLAAVEAWVAGRDHAAEWKRWEGWLATIASALAGLPSLITSIEQPGVANVAPTLAITWDQALLPCRPADIHQALWKGEPRIAMHLRPNGLLVMPYMMEPGEDAVVATRLRYLLENTRCAAYPLAPPAADVSGAWQLEVDYVRGNGRYQLELRQEGNGVLNGSLNTPYAQTPIQGHIEGTSVTFNTTLGYQSSSTTYTFHGRLDGAALQGDLDLGEFGHATWRAQRC